jgi:hypothetical protein
MLQVDPPGVADRGQFSMELSHLQEQGPGGSMIDQSVMFPDPEDPIKEKPAKKDDRQAALSFSEIFEIFMGRSCQGCGGSKAPRHGFCGSCYYRLPKALRYRLYRRFGEGYEPAHQVALNWLRARRLVDREKRRA